MADKTLTVTFLTFVMGKDIMNVEQIKSDFLKSLQPYAFAEVDRIKREVSKRGVDIIDFGVGDPTDETPDVVRNACKEAIDYRKSSGYPEYEGTCEFRNAVARWFKRRFNVMLDADSEITACIGSKQAIFTFHFAFVNKGDYVIVPDPGYPPYTTGTLSRYGKPYYVPLREENNFLMDLDTIPENILKKTKILWTNYPNNPTTALATKEFFKSCIDLANDFNFVIASDEAYSEIYYDRKPISIFNVRGGKECAVVFNSCLLYTSPSPRD